MHIRHCRRPLKIFHYKFSDFLLTFFSVRPPVSYPGAYLPGGLPPGMNPAAAHGLPGMPGGLPVGYPRGMLPAGYEHAMRGIPPGAGIPGHPSAQTQMAHQVPGKP